MATGIVDYELPDTTHNLYDVTLDTHKIHTVLTHTPSMVDSWISDTLQLHHHHPTTTHNNNDNNNDNNNNNSNDNNDNNTNPLMVGLDIEWRPNFNPQIDNPIATLQLCVADRCLIFQILHSPSIPNSLIDFLGNRTCAFVGVGIQHDVEKLLLDYGLGVANVVDIGALAATKLGKRELRSSGLKSLAKEVLGIEVEKPKRVTLSRWDNEWLTCVQVQYACIDAFLSFEIGKHLNAASGV
ncbi:3'-5' exonuclease [Ziziphus jujuba]|uniref:3'-5' exonuclease n=1 Tax=Ziziphus jujuba TaxID=326968 RepID=A0A6P3ZPV0_ZIZJJ|nr:3'-5' exonuclease [Ziziphus jujuba]